MYSSLFRELHASRLQLDMTSAEERELTVGQDDSTTSDVTRSNDACASDQDAIYESLPELTGGQDLASFGNNMAPYENFFEMPESRALLGAYYGSNLSNASPGDAFVSRFLTNDGVFGIPYILRSGQQTELVGCPALAMAAVVLPEAYDITSGIISHLQQQQQQPSLADAQQVHATDAIPSSLVGFSVIGDAAGVVTVPSSSSSSPSSSLSVMSASGAGAGGCGESSEDATTAAAAADGDHGCGSSSSKESSSRESPHSGLFSTTHRCEEEGLPLAGGPLLDRSSPSEVDPSRLLHDSAAVTLDHRRNSLELSCGSRELVDGTNHLSQAGIVAAAAGDVPAHLRRASIPCMSVSAARGLARTTAAAHHLAHRPSVPLDYESLKVKLEELTGTVTDGKRTKETTGGDRSRRTSLVSLTYQPTAASGSSAMTPHPEVDRLTPTLTASTTVATVVGEGTAAGSHSSSRSNGFTAYNAVAEADEETDCCLLQQSASGLQPQEPIDAAITQNSKTSQNPTEDLSSSSSSSSSSSLSLSTSSSSSWDKFRLQCIIEHVLQYDVRLQEILKRHQLEMAAIHLKHRFQWVELEKLLTQRLGDQWRKFITIPALSAPPEGVSTSPWRYPASVKGTDMQMGQRDEPPPGCSVGVQIPFDPLHTIREGQVDEDQLDSNAIKMCQQQTTTQCALQYNGHQAGDAAKSSAVNATDHSSRRCSTDVSVDTPQRPRAISLSNVLLVGDKATTGDSGAESRICQNIASSLARRQSSVAIMNPNSSRLHRHTTAAAKDVAPTRPDTFIPSTRPDSSASGRTDPSASIRPDSAASSRPSTPQGDYRQLLLLAQALQNQAYNSRMAQFLLPNVLPTFPAVPFQTTNFAASYGCDPASYGCDPTSLMALNSGIPPMEMGNENGIDLNGFRPTQALHVEVPPDWTSGHQSASKNSTLQPTGEETSRGLPVGYAQTLNGYSGFSQEVPAVGYPGQTMHGYSFPGLLPSHLAPCQLPSIGQNPWLLRTGGTMGDGPMTFVTPSSSSLQFPYTMAAPNPALYSLLKDYNELIQSQSLQ